MDEIEKKAAEIAATLKASEEKMDALTKENLELKKSLEDLGKKGDDASKEAVELKKAIDNIDASIAELKKENDELKKREMKSESAPFFSKLADLLVSDEFKSEVNAVVNKKQSSTKTFEIKTDGVLLANYTGDVNRTINTTNIGSLSPAPNVFITALQSVPVPDGKNNIMFIDGSYTSAVGYVDELTALTNADTAAVEEKYRELAKIGTFLPISSESISDLSFYVNWARTEGLKFILADLDKKIFSGDGNDSTAKKHIYGLKTQGSTAFSATTAGMALSVESANVSDLVLAIITQIKIQSNEMYQAAYVFAHPTTVSLLRALKNKNNDYLITLPNGQVLIHGLPVIETSRLTVNELFVMSTMTSSLYDKGTIEVEMERIASTDSFKMHMRWRGNVVVPTYAKLGNVYVANITTAIAALDKTTTTTTSGS